MTIEIRAATREERPAVQHLIDLAYSTESHGPSLDSPCISVGQSHLDPHDRPENTRVLLVNGELVSVAHVLARQAYACAERVVFGVVTDVGTHPEQRGRGYMRLLMADTERYMRERGMCYAVLFGRLAFYAGSLGWRWPGERLPSLSTVLVLSAGPGPCGKSQLGMATDDDVPFLARTYEGRYGARFGPVVRSHEYWRRWSLQRPWEGSYLVVREEDRPLGYFRLGNGIDEIGWPREDGEAAARVMRAASGWAAARGDAEVRLWLDEPDTEATETVRRAFGDVPRAFVDAMGQETDNGGPAHMLQRLRPDGSALLVKWLRAGPGPLAGVDSTEALTEVMAQHHWLMFDGDMA